VLVELGSGQPLGAVVLAMGSFSFAFPRELAVDLSNDDREWRLVWSGRTDLLALRAALAEPERVPLAVPLDGAAGRFLRLRQIGRDRVVPWWVPEVEVYPPAAASSPAGAIRIPGAAPDFDRLTLQRAPERLEALRDGQPAR
jgi:hypothetical protein